MNDVVIPSNSPQRNIYGPITPGEMFERTFALLRENPGLFFGIVLVVIGVEIVVGGVTGIGGVWMGRTNMGAAPIARVLFEVPLALIGAALVYIFTQIIQGALFLATRAKLGNAPMTVGEACSLAANNVGRLVGISILVALRIIGYMLLLDFAAGLLLFLPALALGDTVHLTDMFRAGHGPLVGAGIFYVFFMLAVFVVYVAVMFWVVLRYAVAIPAALEEDLPITDAIHRSITLSRGSKGRLIALYLSVACAWIVMAAFTVPLQLMARHSVTGHAGFLFAAAAIRILFSWLVIAFAGVATALCYFDLRVRKDGFGAAPAAPIVEIPPAASGLSPDWPIEDLPVT
jgi:hypothetical protein